MNTRSLIECDYTMPMPSAIHAPASEITFIAEVDPDCGFSARAVGESIFTQGSTLEELKAMVLDAVACHFNDEKPRRVRLILPTLDLLPA